MTGFARISGEVDDSTWNWEVRSVNGRNLDRPDVIIHPEAVRALAISDDDRVRLGNARGEVLVHAKPFDGLQQGVVVVEGVWCNTRSTVESASTPRPVRTRGRPTAERPSRTAIWIRPAH